MNVFDLRVNGQQRVGRVDLRATLFSDLFSVDLNVYSLPKLASNRTTTYEGI